MPKAAPVGDPRKALANRHRGCRLGQIDRGWSSIGGRAAADYRPGTDRWVARISSRFLSRGPDISPLCQWDDEWVSSVDNSGPNRADFAVPFAYELTHTDSPD